MPAPPIRRIPLFPLNVVLFPEMLLPLHIFEPRYRKMVRHCIEGDRTFGVVLIREGEEVGGPAEPHRIGTTCEILGTNQLGGGRLNLVTVGRRRFEIRCLYRPSDEQDYLEGEIAFVDGDESGDLTYLAEQVRDLTHRYVNRILVLQGQQERALDLPDDPERLSFFVGSVLQAPLPARQELLELRSTEDRLRRQVALLEAGLEEMESLEPQRNVARPYVADPKRIRLN